MAEFAPINYATQNPLQAIAGGMQLGAALDEMALAKQQQQAASQAAQQQQQAQTLMQRVMSNPNSTAADYNSIVAMNPAMHKQIQEAWDRASAVEQQSTLSSATRTFEALRNQRPDVAKKIIDEHITAAQNAGKSAQEIAQLRSWGTMIDQEPDVARMTIGAAITAMPGGDKVFTAQKTAGDEARERELAPAKLTEQQAKAKSAAVGAKFAESNAVKDLEKKGWDIYKIQQDVDIAKQNSRIAAMNAATSREGNDLKRQELKLKIGEAIQKRDDTVREKAAALETGRANIDNMLNTADRILKNKSLDSVLGSIQGRMGAYVSDDANDAISLIDTLKSQSFIAQIPSVKGMGALSNAEGEKLQSALQNLDRTQSEKQFKENLLEVQRLMLKARKNMALQHGVPDTTPDTPAAAPSGTDVDALIRKYGGGR